MNREALIQLRRVVQDAPDERFDMRYFERDTECGTVHCAAGWAAVDPWFQENCPIPSIGKAGRWCAISETFGLSIYQSSILFSVDMLGEAYPDVSKRAVIANIDRLLAGENPIPYNVR